MPIRKSLETYLMILVYKCKYKIQIHMQEPGGCKYRQTPLCRYERFIINIWLWFFDMRRETILKCLSLLYYANNTHNVRHISWCFRSQFIFASRDPKNLTAAVTAENSTVCLHRPMSTVCLHGQTSTSQHYGRTSTSQHHGWTSTECFSKSSKFSAHLFWA